MIVGYARVSALQPEADLDEQARRLAEGGATDIVCERTTASGPRDHLIASMERLGAGDTLMVASVGALGHSVADVWDTMSWLEETGVSLRVLDLDLDTATADGKVMARTVGGLAEFETSMRRERQLEGIARAKAEGRYKGRPPSIDPAKVRELQAEGMGATAIAERLGIGRASVYRAMSPTAATVN